MAHDPFIFVPVPSPILSIPGTSDGCIEIRKTDTIYHQEYEQPLERNPDDFFPERKYLFNETGKGNGEDGIILHIASMTKCTAKPPGPPRPKYVGRQNKY